MTVSPSRPSAGPSGGQSKGPLLTAFIEAPADASTLIHNAWETAVAEGRAGKTAGLDCRSGCSHCCRGYVTVRAPEIFELGRAIRALPPERREALKQRIAATDKRTRGRSIQQRAAAAVSCPLLDENGGCSLYEARPLACRILVSFDVKACRRLFAGLGESIPLPAGRTETGGRLLAAFDQAAQMTGRDNRPHELVAGLAITLSDDTAEQRWTKGEDVLAEARSITRPTSDR